MTCRMCCLSPPFVKCLPQCGHFTSLDLFRSAISISEDQPFRHRAKESKCTCAFDGNGSRKRAPFQRDECGSFALLSCGSGTARRKHTADIPGLGGIAASRARAGEGVRWNSRAVCRARGGQTKKKSHMAALRTTINNWKIPVQRPPGFLRLLSEAEFRAALASLPSQPTITEPVAIESPTSVHPPHATSHDMETVLSLSPDFEDRARAMLEALVEVKAIT